MKTLVYTGKTVTACLKSKQFISEQILPFGFAKPYGVLCARTLYKVLDTCDHTHCMNIICYHRVIKGQDSSLLQTAVTAYASSN